MNFDLSNLVQWLRAYKIALNVNKTEIEIFPSPRKQITNKINFRFSGQISGCFNRRALTFERLH